MIATLYLEEAVRHHPVTERVVARFPHATAITIDRYGEVFNRKNQHFRLQKQHPALILARKHGQCVLPAPAGYGVGLERNFYFSHMLNCLYDCRYCFLQGMYRSAYYVLFVNYEDFIDAIDQRLAETPEELFFYSGYDCDSLALEPVSGFVEAFLPVFRARPRAWLELRTKSTQIRALTKTEPFDNAVVAFSFTPAPIAQALEHRVPSVARRIAALQVLARAGWRLGLRFDPLIFDPNYRALYGQLFDELLRALPVEALHSISLGPFRLPKEYFHTIRKLYPDEALFAGEFSCRNGVISYPETVEAEMRDFCLTALARYVDLKRVYSCEF